MILFTNGIHDGKIKNFIAIKDKWVTEGVEPQYLRKLILSRN